MPLGGLEVAVDCSQCGKGVGIPEGETLNRCLSCGRYAESADEYCLTHNIDYEGLYPEDNHCPHCREERRIESMEQERMARRADPNMHPTIDAPRR